MKPSPKFSLGERVIIYKEHLTLSDRVAFVEFREFKNGIIECVITGSHVHYKGWAYSTNLTPDGEYLIESQLRPYPKEETTEWDESIWSPKNVEVKT